MSILVAVGVGVLIGAVLGLLGAGGSLLTVPAMIFLLGLTTSEATGTSLVAVGMMAVSGAIVHGRAGRCSCREGLLFGAAAAVTAVLAGLAASSIPETALTIAFVVVLLGTVVWLLGRDETEDETPDVHQADTSRARSPIRAGLAGGGVGVLTGLLGVGGGFIVVPALMATRRMPIALAVGTSQMVVAISAAAGLAGRIPGGTVQWQIGLLVGAGGIVGAAAGSKLADRAPSDTLRKAFASVATLVAVLMTAQLITS